MPVNNAPQCADLYNQSMTLIQDLNIYDLYRTQYPELQAVLANRNRPAHELN